MKPTLCPKCGFPRKENDTECLSCGVVYKKYEEIKKRKEGAYSSLQKNDKYKDIADTTVVILKYMIVGVGCLWIFFNNFPLEKKKPETPAIKPATVSNQITEAEKTANLARKEQERIELERKRKAEYEACKKDLQCWADKHSLKATYASQDTIERHAKYDFEWIDGFWGTKLNRVSWLDKSRLTLVYYGDQIKMQNGYGAWQRHVYKIEYDPVNEKVLGVKVWPGRLK